MNNLNLFYAWIKLASGFDQATLHRLEQLMLMYKEMFSEIETEDDIPWNTNMDVEEEIEDDED